MNKHPSLRVRFNNDFKQVNNSEFVEGTALIAYQGDNRNSSDIVEQAFTNAMPSLSLIPIVGNWLVDKQNFGGHDIAIEWQGNTLVLKDKTVPYGVVKENHNAQWVELDDNGVTHKYLQADVVLWAGRYPEQVQKVIDNGINQSMEISVNDYSIKENGNFQINSFEYSALCLLGKDVDENGLVGDDNVEPCFEQASVVVNKYNFNEQFKSQFNNLLFEFNNQISELINNPLKGGDKGIMKNEGGNTKLDKKLELLQKYNLTTEQLDFSIDEIELEDLENKLKEFSIEKDKNLVTFSATYRQKRDALDNALDPKIERDADGNLTYEEYLWVEDFDDEYVYVEKSIWTANDYERKYGRFTYTFDEVAISATITGEFEEMLLVWLTLEENQKLQEERTNAEIKFEKLKGEYEEYKNKYSTLNEDVDVLKEFQASTLSTQRKESEEEIFSQFEQLNENEQFQELKKNASQFTLEQLEEKSALIVVKSGANIKFTAKINKRQTVKLNLNLNHDPENKPYGELFSKYLPKQD